MIWSDQIYNALRWREFHVICRGLFRLCTRSSLLFSSLKQLWLSGRDNVQPFFGWHIPFHSLIPWYPRCFGPKCVRGRIQLTVDSDSALRSKLPRSHGAESHVSRTKERWRLQGVFHVLRNAGNFRITQVTSFSATLHKIHVANCLLT